MTDDNTSKERSMSEDKISTHELVAIFGKEIPAEAFTLVAISGRMVSLTTAPFLGGRMSKQALGSWRFGDLMLA
jgi:hypothetical protein